MSAAMLLRAALKRTAGSAIVAVALVVAGCGSGGDSSPATGSTGGTGGTGGGGGGSLSTSYSLGGTITGLTGSGLVLADNGILLPENSGATSFSFGSILSAGSAYSVSVQTAPSGLTCSVANGTGSAGSADVANVVVTCSTTANAYTLGGPVTGLTSTGLVLANGADTLAVAANATSFTLPKLVAFASGYAVTVSSQPATLSCSITNGAGTMPASNVTNVAVTCSAKSYTLGGTISGLTTAGLVLANGTDTLNVSPNATSFTLSKAVAAGGTYAITVATQPTGLTCSVSSGTGTVSASNVTNVLITCSVNAYTLGGTITGLTAAGLVLANGANTLSVAANASAFTMPAGVAYLSPYAVTVTAQPTGLTCAAASGSGTMPAANVTSVRVSCSAVVVVSAGWDWVGGSQYEYANGAYGTQGVAASGNTPGSRYQAVTWADNSGNLWLFSGGGADAFGTHGRLNDLWKFNTSSRQWTWVGGSAVADTAGVYGTKGVTAPSNMPGGRSSAASWTDPAGNLWLFGGTNISANGYFFLNDLWKFSPSTGQWTWVTGANTTDSAGVYGTLGVAAAGNTPGARKSAVTWSDSAGNLWLFGGTGFDGTGSNQHLNDLWKYSTSTGLWTWVSGSAIGNAPGVFGTQGVAAAGNAPSARQEAHAWRDGSGNLWLFGGYGPDPGPSALNGYGDWGDLWKFSPTTGLWTWVSGATVGGSAGVYGTQGVAAAGNAPGARNSAGTWVDAAGNFWLIAGFGYDSAHTWYGLNDLWKYQPATGQWTWVKGSTFVNGSAAYGAQGTAASGNTPGARNSMATWTDSAGGLWMFGGIGLDAAGNYGYLNDLWKY